MDMGPGRELGLEMLCGWQIRVQFGAKTNPRVEELICFVKVSEVMIDRFLCA